jgi:hypothetical protein
VVVAKTFESLAPWMGDPAGSGASVALSRLREGSQEHLPAGVAKGDVGGTRHDVERNEVPLRLEDREEESLRLAEVEVAVGERPVRLELPAQVPGRVARSEERVGGLRVGQRAVGVDVTPPNLSETSITTLRSLCSARCFNGVKPSRNFGSAARRPSQSMLVGCNSQSPSQVTRASMAPGVVLPRQPADACGWAKAIIAAMKLAPCP